MKEHNYVYNYGFLADWMKANPLVRRSDILQGIDMCDYGTLAKWTSGETMMPMIQMMKFCNAFSVPVTAFFMDEKADDESCVAPILPDAQIEPAGGWPDSSRKTGIKVCDPRTTTHMPSNLPGYVRMAGVSHPAKHEVPKAQGTPVQVTESEDIPQNERMRYLDMIEKLNDRVMKLSEDNIALHEKLAKLKSEEGYLGGMAAEPTPQR